MELKYNIMIGMKAGILKRNASFVPVIAIYTVEEIAGGGV
jgi:hypothetical protein